MLYEVDNNGYDTNILHVSDFSATFNMNNSYDILDLATQNLNPD